MEAGKTQGHVQRLAFLLHDIFERVAIKRDYPRLSQQCRICGKECGLGTIEHTDDCRFTQLDNLIADIETAAPHNRLEAVVLWPNKDEK